MDLIRFSSLLQISRRIVQQTALERGYFLKEQAARKKAEKRDVKSNVTERARLRELKRCEARLGVE